MKKEEGYAPISAEDVINEMKRRMEEMQKENAALKAKVDYAEALGLELGMMKSSDRAQLYLTHQYRGGSELGMMFALIGENATLEADNGLLKITIQQKVEQIGHAEKAIDATQAELTKQRKINDLRTNHCERKHAFCPDCRDKLPDNFCWRCEVQRLKAQLAKSVEIIAKAKKED